MSHAVPPLRSGGGGAARKRRDGGGWLLTALGAAMLMWTAMVNGRPPVFTDTALYYAQAEYLFEALDWVRPADAVEPPGDPTALPSRPGAPNISASIDRARSPAYGAPVYLLQRLGGLWLAAAVQAFAVAGAIHLLYRAAAPRRPRWGYLLLMASLAALTPLPFFASWIMPDVFAGVAGCGLILLIVYPDRLGPGRRAGATALTAFALAAHRSNLVDGLVVTGVGAAMLRMSGIGWTPLLGRVLPLAAAGVVALVVPAVLEAPIQGRAGEPIGSPPFLSARVLADGPGRTYLRRTCRGPETPFELCRFEAQPMATSDQVLWSIRRRTAVFLAAGPAGRLRMEREDGRFALDETLAEPGPQARAAAANALTQFGEVLVDDPLKPQDFYVTDPYWRHTVLPRILPDAAACRRPCPPRIGRTASEGLEGLGLGLSALVLLWRLAARETRAVLLRRRRDDDLARALAALALVAVLLTVNAVVCGALSGPFPRYQARLVWLFPLGVALLAAAAGPRRHRLAESQ